MSATVLREAAAKMREEWSLSPSATFCQCDEADAWFDRSICPEPCDSMHNICVECGLIQGYCSVAVMGRDNGNRLALSWLAVAYLLDRAADDHDETPCPTNDAALTVARAYMNCEVLSVVPPNMSRHIAAQHEGSDS